MASVKDIAMSVVIPVNLHPRCQMVGWQELPDLGS